MKKSKKTFGMCLEVTKAHGLHNFKLKKKIKFCK